MPQVIRRRNHVQILQQQLKIEGLPQEPEPMTIADVRERMERGDNVVFLDVRSRKEWEESAVKLPHAYRMPVNEVEQFLRRIPKDALIIPYCT